MAERLPEIDPWDLSSFGAAERAAMVTLAGLPAMTPKRFWASISGTGPLSALRAVVAGTNPIDARRLYAGWQAGASHADPMQLLAAHRARGIDVMCYGDPGYPTALIDDLEPPPVLFGVGPAEIGARPAVAIVGTRRCTNYGRGVATDLAAALAERGVDIVSGLARGIDAAAHVGARRVRPDAAIAVVACGLDVVYPQGNRGLWQDIAASGRIVSEWPLGVRPERWAFPARNRLIAALSSATVVVESRTHGGSMHTVDEALARDRRVVAVPGSIRSPVSAGTNSLIFNGAEVLVSIEEFVASEAPYAPASKATPHAEAPESVSSWLLDAVGFEPVTVDALVQATGRPIAEVIGAVELEIARGVLRRSGSTIERTP